MKENKEKMNNYYDGTKLLSMKDIEGNTPEIFIVTTNRSGGKTTYFGRMLINNFKKKKIRKFAILYRYKYELDECADKFFKDLKSLFFNGDEMTSSKKCNGLFIELELNGIPCGYCLALNSADSIKKISHFFSDVDAIFLDEFQVENGEYCTNEIQKFISIHQSIARGNGKQSRYVPCFMCANTVSLLNPYYTALGISTRLNKNTKFLKGRGFVLEQGFVDSARNAQQESTFNKAFYNDEYIAYSTQNKYLDDNESFIEKVNGKGKYICTIKYNNKNFGVREYSEQGIICCDDKPDISYPLRIAATTDDHQINYVMLKQNDFLIQLLRYYFNKGCFRFKDLSCKEAILNTLTY